MVIDFASRTLTSAAPVSRTDAPVAMVRTGTGAIEVAAARDVTLGMAKFFRQTSNDEFIDNPAIYDSVNIDGTYKVSVYGAALYTAGKQVADGALALGAPTNALNVHYGAAAGTNSAASFADSGGAIRIAAGRDLVGARNLGSDWFYRNNDGTAADPGDRILRHEHEGPAACRGRQGDPFRFRRDDRRRCEYVCPAAFCHAQGCQPRADLKPLDAR